MLTTALQTAYMELKEIAISSLIVGIIVVLKKTEPGTQQENELWLYYSESCSDKAEHASPSHGGSLSELKSGITYWHQVGKTSKLIQYKNFEVLVYSHVLPE